MKQDVTKLQEQLKKLQAQRNQLERQYLETAGGDEAAHKKLYLQLMQVNTQIVELQGRIEMLSSDDPAEDEAPTESGQPQPKADEPQDEPQDDPNQGQTTVLPPLGATAPQSWGTPRRGKAQPKSGKSLLMAALVLALVALLGYGVAAASATPAAMVPNGLSTVSMLFPSGSATVANNTEATDATTTATAETQEAAPVEQDEVIQLQEQLTVNPNDLQTEQYASMIDNDWGILRFSLSPYDDERARQSGISDAVTLPFSSKTDIAVIEQELYREILKNPVYGIGMLDFLRGIQIGDKTIGDLNPWMDEVIAKNENAENGCGVWMRYVSATDRTIVVSDEYKVYASGICTLLARMKIEGIGVYQTTENWHLSESLLNSDRKLVVSSYQYQGDFVVYTYFGKHGQALMSIGFNLADKRPALITELEGTTPVTPDTTNPIDPPPVPPTPPTPPTPPDPPVPPTPPDPPVPPTPPDPPDPGDDDPTKDPTKDPDAQGNADKGGGVNDDPGPGKYEDQHESTSTGSSSVTGNNGSAGNSTTGPVGGSSTDTGSTPPATDPIPPVDSSTGTDNATGESGDTANDENTGTIVMPD